ncbi:hypothetical protein Tco_0287041 [Tanacetum coccineum]
MNNFETQLNAETLHEMDSKSALSVIKAQFEREVLPAESSSTDTALEQVQNNDENNVFANERQHSENMLQECAERLMRLLFNCKFKTLEAGENKTILKQLKKAQNAIIDSRIG